MDEALSREPWAAEEGWKGEWLQRRPGARGHGGGAADGSWSTAPASPHNTDHGGELCNAWQMMVNMVNK